jgi:hypothetical protein
MVPTKFIKRRNRVGGTDRQKENKRRESPHSIVHPSFGISPKISGWYIASIRVGGIEKDPD